jgi:ubiquinone biosynthesis protein
MNTESPFSHSSETLLAQHLNVGLLVPERYADYRPVVRDAFLFFLRSLPLERQWAMAREQLEMPSQASLTARVFNVLHACPSLHKLGQVLAHDRSLCPELLERLQALETMPPQTPISVITRTIRQAIGSPPGLELAPQALAEASVAVVLPFSWSPPDGGERREGVFKVLKPGVSETLHQELDIWTGLGSYLENRCEAYGLPSLKYRDTFEQLRRLLLRETRLDLEQANLKRAAALYADCPEIRIPRLLPFCTPRLTAMELIPGVKVTEVSNLAEPERRTVAEAIIRNLMARPLWSRDDEAFFHADPHGGNMLLTPDGRVAVLDWSLVTTLDTRQRSGLVQIVLGALGLDRDSVCRSLSSLAASPPDQITLKDTASRELRRLTSGSIPGFHWLLGLMDRAVSEAGVNFPESLAMYRKALHTLLGVVSDISAACSLDGVLMSSGIQGLVAEWPKRAVSPAHSRDFATPVSTSDLAGLVLTSPLLPLKVWNSWWRDLLLED